MEPVKQYLVLTAPFKRVCKLSFSAIVMLLNLLQVLGNLFNNEVSTRKICKQEQERTYQGGLLPFMSVGDSRGMCYSTCKKEEPDSVINISSLKPLQQVVSSELVI